MLSPLRARFANELDDFVAYMASEQGLSPISIRSHRWKTSKFLEWFANRHRLLSSATLDDVDEFLAFKANNGWNRESVSTAAQALRSFFRHAERRGWGKAGIAAGIQGPKIYQYAGLPEGPTCDDVRRVLQSSKGSSPAAVRARAILLLVAVYGLRSGEVRRILLDDIDGRAETFVVTHSIIRSSGMASGLCSSARAIACSGLSVSKTSCVCDRPRTHETAHCTQFIIEMDQAVAP